MWRPYGVEDPPKSGNSKIRFIMLEADLADGDLTQISQAISQAMRQGQPITRQPASIAARAAVIPPAGAAQDEEGDESVTEPDADESQETEEAPATSRPRASRKYPAPKVIDLDLNAGAVPFEKFAMAKGNPSAHLKRYLLSAYWLKENLGIESVNMNHIYTCYRKMGWNTNMRDFAQPLRDLARNNANGEFKDGSFMINLMGGGVVEKMEADD
jgi:hypothetical protein